jgi:hypothetical protein
MEETNGYFRKEQDKEQDISSSKHQTGFVFHPASCTVGSAFFSWRQNAGACHLPLPPPSIDVKNGWNCSFSPPYTFMA